MKAFDPLNRYSLRDLRQAGVWHSYLPESKQALEYLQWVQNTLASKEGEALHPGPTETFSEPKPPSSESPSQTAGISSTAQVVMLSALLETQRKLLDLLLLKAKEASAPSNSTSEERWRTAATVLGECSRATPFRDSAGREWYCQPSR